MERRLVLPVIAAVLFLCEGALLAQPVAPGTVAAQREELEVIRQLEAEIPEAQGTTYDYGGWYRFSFTRYDDAVKNREVIDHDVRLWASFTFADIHQFYVRVRTDLADWRDHDSPEGHNDDLEGPNLDQGWYRVRLKPLAAQLLNEKWPVDVDVKIGRQYIEVGHGVVFSRIFDAAAVDVGSYYFTAQFFAGDSTKSDHNLDVSAPKYWHDRRSFAGVQGTLKNVIPRVEPYAYALWVDDRNDYEGGPAGQAFGYDPTYFGVGARANPFPDLRAWAEFIDESGKSHASGSARREKIDACAFVVGAEYLLRDCPTRPRFEVEYGLGSGDSDRASATNTVGGNTPFTKDKGFLAYGYHDTGVAFAPRLANLRVLRVTSSFHPLEFVECLRDFELGASFYWFDKDKRAGGTSDVTSSLPSKDLGTELDLFANWRVTSDVLWTIRWGKFDLGDAFAGPDDSREYLLTTITYNF